MDDRSVSLNYYLSKEYRDPPKAFWKYYDLYRRKQITLDEYAVMTGLLELWIHSLHRTSLQRREGNDWC